MELSDAESRRRIFESALGRRKRYRDRVFGHSIRQQFSQEAGATSLGRGRVRSIDRGTGNFRADSLDIVDSNSFVDSVEAIRPLRQTRIFPLAIAILWYAFVLLYPLTYLGLDIFQNFVNNAFLWVLIGILFRLPEIATIQPFVGGLNRKLALPKTC